MATCSNKCHSATPAICRRFSSFAAIGLLLLTLCAAAPKHEWELQPPSETDRLSWEWRNEWAVPLSPPVARIVQELVSRNAPLVNWSISPPAGFTNLIESSKTSPFDKLTLLWWYRDENVKYLPSAIRELGETSLSPNWAYTIGVLFEDAAQRCGDDVSEARQFNQSAEKYYRIASQTDPNWAMPYYALMKVESQSLLEPVPANQLRSAGAGEWKYKPQLPLASFGRLRELMRLHQSAQDYRILLPPPWLARFSSESDIPDGALLVSSFVEILRTSKKTALEDALWLLCEASIYERDFAGLTELAEFAEGLQQYELEGYCTTSQQYLGIIKGSLKYRLWDASKYKGLSSELNQIWMIARRNDFEKYRMRHRSTPWADIQRESNRIFVGKIEEMRPHYKQFQQVIRGLRPNDIAPAEVLSAHQRNSHYALKAANVLWPFCAECKEILSEFPMNTELTDSGEIFAAYLSGYMVGGQLRFSYGASVSGIRAFVDQKAGFGQRLAAAYWRDDGALRREIIDEIEVNPKLVETVTPEIAYMLFVMSERTAVHIKARLNDDNAAEKYFKLADKYITLSAEKDPDWAVSQLLLTTWSLDRAIAGARQRGLGWNIASLYSDLSKEQVADIYGKAQAFMCAEDTRRLLPSPWLIRLSPSELSSVKRSYDLGRFEKLEGINDEADASNSPVFVAHMLISCAPKGQEAKWITEGLKYVQALMSYGLEYDSKPYDYTMSVSSVITWASEQASSPELKKSLKDLSRRPIDQKFAIERMNDWRTKALDLTEEQEKLAWEGWESQMSLYREELNETLVEAISLVSSSKPEDFLN